MLMLMNWKEEYKLNIENIDKEHKTLFELGNDLLNRIYVDKDQIEIKRSIDELIEHTKTHFANEEILMKQKNYYGINKHLAEHENLIRSIEKKYDKIIKAEDIEEKAKFLTFIIEWIIRHIIDEDRKFGKFYHGNDICKD